MHVWRSNERSQFDRMDDLPLNSDSFTLRVEPESVYSLTTTTGPATGLRVRFESRCHQGFPDCDWVLYLENTASRDTPVIENIQALDLTVATPLEGDVPYRLHRTKGAPADPTDFEPAIVPLKARQTERLSAGGGRSSNRDFPFFKVETGEGSLIVAVGWSGQWAAALNSPDGHHLRVTAGQEQTHFILHPGERVRSPRMLLFGSGRSLEPEPVPAQ
jgi:hypothetical protein